MVAGVETEPTNTGTTSRLQASLIVGGAAGAVAAAGHVTTEAPGAGGVNAPLYVTV